MTLKFTACLFISIIFSFSLNATHIRGGEIEVEKIGNHTYKINLILYLNSNSPVTQPSATINLGDGTNNTANISVTETISNDTYKNTYEITKSYTAPGTYLISFTEFNRNASILNIANSVDVPFYVETFLNIEKEITNSYPTLFPLTLNKIPAGANLNISIASFDKEGDDLFYKIITPKQATNTDVPGYRIPSAEVFEINSTTGLLSIKNFTQIGLYTIAIEISEKRNSKLLSKTVRDFQLEVIPSAFFNFKPPIISSNFDLVNYTPNHGDVLKLNIIGKFPQSTPGFSTSILGNAISQLNATTTLKDSISGNFFYCNQVEFVFDTALYRKNGYDIIFRQIKNGTNIELTDTIITIYLRNPKVDYTVSVYNAYQENAVPTTVYPNPTSNNVNVKFKDNKVITFVLYSVSSQKLITQKIDQYNNIINLSNFNPGIYYYTLSSTDGEITSRGKILKE